MLPTRTCPGVIGWPLPHRCGGRTIHWPPVDRTSRPTWTTREVVPVGHAANDSSRRRLLQSNGQRIIPGRHSILDAG